MAYPRPELLCLLIIYVSSTYGMDVAVSRPCGEEPLVQGYDPTTLGYAWQGDDEPFIDFTLSLKAHLFRDFLCKYRDGRGHLYLTFTGRFAFYVRTRDSGPVIAREYNPKLLWRWISTDEKTVSTTYDRNTVQESAAYIDFAYAHSANGQTIDTLQEYEIQSYESGSARDALDYISRGWDYVEATGKLTLLNTLGHGGDLSMYPDFKFFLRHGLLQGVPEEYHSWEQDSTLLPRHAFDGLSVTFDYRPFAQENRGVGVNTEQTLRFAIKYLTGYDPVARYNTIRGEVGLSPWGLPLTLWALSPIGVMEPGMIGIMEPVFSGRTDIPTGLRMSRFLTVGKL